MNKTREIYLNNTKNIIKFTIIPHDIISIIINYLDDRLKCYKCYQAEEIYRCLDCDLICCRICTGLYCFCNDCYKSSNESSCDSEDEAFYRHYRSFEKDSDSDSDSD